MMQFIRERSKGLLSFLLIGFIALTFALWGINSYFTGNARNSVAEIGARTISADEFNRFYQQQYRQLQSLYGDAFRPEMIDETQLKKKVLDAMVSDSVLRQHLVKQGMVISDAQLASAINQLPTFQESGRFSSDLYQEWLKSRGYSAAAFENELRASMLTDLARANLRDSSIVSPFDMRELIRLTNQKRDLALISISVNNLASQIEASDAELEAFFEEHLASFQEPEQIRVHYVLIRREEVASQIAPPDEAVLRELYASDGRRFGKPERRRVRHILLEDESAARSLAAELKNKPDQFTNAAEKQSIDKGSAASGGDLGWIEPGLLPPTLDQAVFAATPGQVIGPVASPDGFHVILVDAVEGARQEPFEKVRTKLIEEYRTAELAKRWGELMDAAESASFENPSTLEPVAKLANAKVQTTEWFTRTQGAAPANSPKFRTAAFGDAVVKDGVNSGLVELDEGTVAILRLDQHRPATTPALASVKEQVQRAYALDRAGIIADERLSEAENALKEGKTPAQVASQIKGSLREIGWTGRQGNASLPPEITAQAFSTLVPSAGSAAITRSSLPNGDRVLILVRQVKDGDASELDTETRAQMKERYSNLVGDQELAVYINALKETMTIKIYPDRL
ncbi:MAG TPA: SurA N-terminal domain-containing protein [Candidatus Acidoferrales bacterium]|nr:SurA N-terminal domain-containing protein [Candidatus Acidoferrales bacterium]